MPHIRLIRDSFSDNDMLYINGTLVLTEEVIEASQILDILRNNLGMDTKTYFLEVDCEEAEAIGWDDYDSTPKTLKQWGDFVDEEDRIGRD